MHVSAGKNYPEVFLNVTKGAELKIRSFVIRVFKLKVVQDGVILSHNDNVTACDDMFRASKLQILLYLK